MLYKRPQIFLKANGSFGKGGGGKKGQIISYSGRKIEEGYYSNLGYDHIRYLPAGSEFTVKDAVRGDITRFRLVPITSRVKELVVLTKKNGKIHYEHLVDPLITDESREGRIQRLVGFNAEKINIFSGTINRKQLDRQARKDIREHLDPILRRRMLRK